MRRHTERGRVNRKYANANEKQNNNVFNTKTPSFVNRKEKKLVSIDFSKAPECVVISPCSCVTALNYGFEEVIFFISEMKTFWNHLCAFVLFLSIFFVCLKFFFSFLHSSSFSGFGNTPIKAACCKCAQNKIT